VPGHHGILVFGLPRSGTTWLGKIFDSHPETLYRHEPDSWQKIDSVPIMPKPEDFDRLIPHVQRFYDSIAGMRAAKVCAKTPIFRKTYLTPARHRLLQIGIPVSRAAGRLGVHLPVAGAPAYLDDEMHLVWKSIESIGRLRLVVRALPAAKAIHLIRHPCGYISSVLRGESRRQFEDNRGASEDYGILEMLLDSTAARQRELSMAYFRGLSPVERLAWRWVLFNDEAQRAAGESHHCRTVRYEDLCADPIRTAKELFLLTGLDWQPQTEQFLRTSTTQEESSYYSVFKKPDVAAGKWREELDTENVRRIKAVVQDTVPGQAYADDW
jgi:hypothetical protein